MHDRHLLRAYSSTQSVISLSSGESEYYGIVKGTSIVLGAKSMAKDFGVDMKVRVWTDATAGKVIASRRGLGRTRHIHTQYLWVQQKVHKKEVELRKEATKDNVADLMTKHLTEVRMKELMRRLGSESRYGQSGLALKAA